MWGVPEPIMSEIKRRAEAEWPGDYAMQLHVIEQQAESFSRLDNYWTSLDFDNEVLLNCRSKATSDWPDDYTMQLHTFEGQVEAANKFFASTHDMIPDSVFEDIKVRAFADWPGDYEMMLHTLNEQASAWLRLNGRLSEGT